MFNFVQVRSIEPLIICSAGLSDAIHDQADDVFSIKQLNGLTDLIAGCSAGLHHENDAIDIGGKEGIICQISLLKTYTLCLTEGL